MYAMNDPRYQYRPLSDERKVALSQAHMRRLGVPDGFRLIYGEHIPEYLADDVRKIAQDEARKGGREAGELVARAFSGTEMAAFRSVGIRPPADEWVLAYWRHMTCGWASKHQKLCGGWYPTRYRKGRWQAQFGSHRCYPVCVPELWTPILPASADRSLEGQDAQRLDAQHESAVAVGETPVPHTDSSGEPHAR